MGIDDPLAKITLSASDCGPGIGGGRAPNPVEQRIFDLWEKQMRKTNNFQGRNLVAFLEQLERIV